MNWLKRIFNWRKAPKATNAMKPVDMSKYFEDADIVLKGFIYQKYWKVKKSWKRSPKKYAVHNGKNGYFLMGYPLPPHKCEEDKSYVGNLYTLYQQYYGKENKD